MKLGTEVGFGPGHIVGPSSPSQKWHSTRHFSAHVYCGRTAGWIEMPVGTEVDLTPGQIVLDGAAPLFMAHVYCGQTVAHLSYC